jgi:hypothetical protein
MSFDAVLIGILTSVAAVVGALFWQLLVHPDETLHRWSEPGVIHEEGWFEDHPAALRALRLLGGGLLVVLGFITGFALTLLTQTS